MSETANPIQPLDFVRALGSKDVGLVTEVNPNGDCSIAWITRDDRLHVAWWYPCDLELVGSLPRLLASNTYHPFGQGRSEVDRVFPKRDFIGEGPSPERVARTEWMDARAKEQIGRMERALFLGVDREGDKASETT